MIRAGPGAWAGWVFFAWSVPYCDIESGEPTPILPENAGGGVDLGQVFGCAAGRLVR